MIRITLPVKTAFIIPSLVGMDDSGNKRCFLGEVFYKKRAGQQLTGSYNYSITSINNRNSASG